MDASANVGDIHIPARRHVSVKSAILSESDMKMRGARIGNERESGKTRSLEIKTGIDTVLASIMMNAGAY